MNIDTISANLDQLLNHTAATLNSSELYIQLGLILLALILAFAFAKPLTRAAIFQVGDHKGAFLVISQGMAALKSLLLPLSIVISLAIAIELSTRFIGQSWLIRMAEGLALVFMIYSIIQRFISNILIQAFCKWVLIPVAILQVFGLLSPVIEYLESLNIEIGNINISAYGVARVFFFGAILFWLGRMSNQAGQKVIRQQQQLDIGTREVLAKIFQVGVFLLIALLLLQVMGINITALAVFGGALGVGLGFGLQAIASNFISGIILLLDRSLAVGDYIELADGRKGSIRELNMRSTLLETYDGKDIMVPNEQFITTSFINWTHKNKKQRYAINLQVAYSTDLHALFDLLREVVASHPKVLSGEDLPIEERPDAEICGFGESGIDILIEFWMEGIDDGEHRVGGDLYLMIWEALKAQKVQIPFPQREIKIIQVGADTQDT